MGFQTTSLDDTAGLAHDAGQGESLLPMAVGVFDVFPIVVCEFVENYDFTAQLFAELEDVFTLHDLARVAHTAAVANGQRTGAHGLELPDDRSQSILMRGARRLIGAIEVRFQEEVFAVERGQSQKINGASNAGRAVRGPDKSDVRGGRLRGQSHAFEK